MVIERAADDLPLWSANPAMQAVEQEIAAASHTLARVLVDGEPGIGKKATARAIHRRSVRSVRPILVVRCAGALEGGLAELTAAHGGTAYLDEVGDMSVQVQARVLRFLDTGEIGDGGRDSGRVDVRIIAGTSRDLTGDVGAGRFRRDLYQALSAIHLKLPPLRERPEDIEQWLDVFMTRFAAEHRVRKPAVSADAMDVIRNYDWPGNVRELKALAERLVLRTHTAVVDPPHLPQEMTAQYAPAEIGFARPSAAASDRVASIWNSMVHGGQSFWTTAYPQFMARDLTRDELRFLIRSGLEQTRGSYRQLLELFNMSASDYSRFVAFLKQYDCHLSFERLRLLSVPRLD